MMVVFWLRLSFFPGVKNLYLRGIIIRSPRAKTFTHAWVRTRVSLFVSRLDVQRSYHWAKMDEFSFFISDVYI